MLLELSVPFGALGLAESDAPAQTISLEFERTVFAADYVSSLVVVTGDDDHSVATALRNSPFLKEVLLVEETDGEETYRISWGETLPNLIERIREAEGTVLQAHSHDGTWRLALRFPNQEAMSRFYSTYDDSEHPLTILRVSTSGPSFRTPGTGVTERQREILRRAWEEGYFDVPRRATLTELADRLNISDTATSQGVRRGTANLLESYLRAPERTAGVQRTED